MEQNSREKRTIIMVSNVKGDECMRKLNFRNHHNFDAFLELYEEIFDLDLYAYRVRFVDR